MPVHDWTRVPAGIFHHFHLLWIAGLNSALNSGILPSDYYALAEQSLGGISPDVLTLHHADALDSGSTLPIASGQVTAVDVEPPQLEMAMQLEETAYTARQNHVAIHHVSDDRVIALLEVVSSGNKNGRVEFERFVRKACDSLLDGCHVTIVDLYPPTTRDPEGIHGAIWSELGDANYMAPDNKPLTLAAYVADAPIRAYVQPTAVGERLRDVPVFLLPTHYVSLPLEAIYSAAFEQVPHRWRLVLEGAAT